VFIILRFPFPRHRHHDHVTTMSRAAFISRLRSCGALGKGNVEY